MRTKIRGPERENMIYFQPPFSLNVKTQVGSKFLGLVKKHFTSKHPLYKILNPKCLNIAYCCLPNVKAEINSANNGLKEIETTANDEVETCTCRGRKIRLFAHYVGMLGFSD